MTHFVTIEEFVATVGLDEVAQVAGVGSFNDADGRALDLPKISEAIAFAEELLISHARARYPGILDLTPDAAPELAKGLICDVARYRLRSRSAGQGQISEEVRKRHEDALSFFKKIAMGQVELPISGLPINGEIAGGVKAAMQPARADQILKGW